MDLPGSSPHAAHGQVSAAQLTAGQVQRFAERQTNGPEPQSKSGEYLSRDISTLCTICKGYSSCMTCVVVSFRVFVVWRNRVMQRMYHQLNDGLPRRG